MIDAYNVYLKESNSTLKEVFQNLSENRTGVVFNFPEDFNPIYGHITGIDMTLWKPITVNLTDDLYETRTDYEESTPIGYSYDPDMVVVKKKTKVDTVLIKPEWITKFYE